MTSWSSKFSFGSKAEKSPSLRAGALQLLKRCYPDFFTALEDKQAAETITKLLISIKDEEEWAEAAMVGQPLTLIVKDKEGNICKRDNVPTPATAVEFIAALEALLEQPPIPTSTSAPDAQVEIMTNTPRFITLETYRLSLQTITDPDELIDAKAALAELFNDQMINTTEWEEFYRALRDRAHFVFLDALGNPQLATKDLQRLFAACANEGLFTPQHMNKLEALLAER